MSEHERTVRVDRPRCPYCHDDILQEQEKIGCPACMAWQHRACFQEHARCTACNAEPAEPATPKPAASIQVGPSLMGFDPQIVGYLKQNKTISAIKRYRELHGGDLKSAKEAVDAISDELGLGSPPVEGAPEGFIAALAAALIVGALIALLALVN